ncbi:hypothetical protein [Streptosporangium sp. NPDC002721]|uniref:DUF7715 family protein n=1 Tax=Streptosporangium sp. NPDC002721 TaxID=3366188 RepID=UPI003680ECE5
MKLLIATTRTQGHRANDFHCGEEGELVRFASVCARDSTPEVNPDGGCGCARSFAGFVTARATTTAMVSEVAMTRDEYVKAMIDAYGFPGIEEEVAAEADYLITLAESLPVGAVLEVRGDEINVRPSGGIA